MVGVVFTCPHCGERGVYAPTCTHDGKTPMSPVILDALRELHRRFEADGLTIAATEVEALVHKHFGVDLYEG